MDGPYAVRPIFQIYAFWYHLVEDQCVGSYYTSFCSVNNFSLTNQLRFIQSRGPF